MLWSPNNLLMRNDLLPKYMWCTAAADSCFELAEKCVNRCCLKPLVLLEFPNDVRSIEPDFWRDLFSRCHSMDCYNVDRRDISFCETLTALLYRTDVSHEVGPLHRLQMTDVKIYSGHHISYI